MAAPAIAAPSAVRTFQPTQRIIGREIRGDRVAAYLECGHVADLPAGCLITTRCAACRPVEVLRG